MAHGRPSLWIFMVALLMSIGLARLGLWQLGRAFEKEALQEGIRAAAALPELDTQALVRSTLGPDFHHRRVKLRGQWVSQFTIYLENRPMGGRAGFIVVTPLVLEGYPGAIAVQRGWIPRDAQDRTKLMAPGSPEGLVEVWGRLAHPPGALLELGAADAQPGPIRQNIDLDAYSVQTGLLLMPFTVLQEGPPEKGLLRDWPAPIVNVQKHYGYAFQWFAMSLLVGGLYVWFQWIRPRRA